MGSPGKIKVEKLKETIIQGYEKEFKIAIVQYKQSYKGLSLYKVFSELKYNGELFDIIESYVTYNRQKSDNYFSKLERRYPEERITRKIF